jgi:hypothetical protein
MLKNAFPDFRDVGRRHILRGPFFEKIGQLFPLICLIFTACQEPKTGCTDIRATNFDVTAGKTDDNTCVFPKLIVQYAYLFGENDTLGLKYDFIYYTPNVPRQAFKILQAATYLSDFQLITSDGKTSTTSDSLSLYRQTDTIRVLNSYALMGKNNGFQSTIGTFQDVGKTFAKCRFNVGFSPEINKTDATKMPFGHPLSLQADSMYNRATKSYIFNKLVLATGTDFKDTLKIEMNTLSNIELTKSLPTKEGYDAVITLKINYLHLFTGVNFTDPQNITKQKIVDNTPKIFSLK